MRFPNTAVLELCSQPLGHRSRIWDILRKLCELEIIEKVMQIIQSRVRKMWKYKMAGNKISDGQYSD